MSDYLSPDAMIEILKRLPAKTLLRFRSVTKAWHSLITNSTFVSQHLEQNNDTHLLYFPRPMYFTIAPKYLTKHFSIHRDNQSFDLVQEFDNRDTTETHNFRFTDICNGLVLFHDYGQRDMILWNPSIRKALKVPKRKKQYGSWQHIRFGFIPKTNDYKIVSIKVSGTLKAQIYELSTNCWRYIDSAYEIAYQPYSPNDSKSQACLRGVVHWFGYSPKAVGDDMIIAFDLETEVFRFLGLPNAVTQQREGRARICNSLCFATFGGSLSLVQIIRSDGGDNCCCIWVMREYGAEDSWTMEFTFNLGIYDTFVGFRRNVDVLFRRNSGELVSYNLQNNEMKNLGIIGDAELFRTATFVDSLVLLCD